MSEKYLIFDCGWYRAPLTDKFKELGLTLLYPIYLTQGILRWEAWTQFNPNKTLLVFPGNGSASVFGERADLWEDWLSKWPWQRRVHAKRIWTPGTHPEVFVDRISPGVFVGFQNVVVIDDVVSSGSTCRKLRELNDPFLPGVRWHAVSWVAQRAKSLRGFSSSFASVEVGTEKTKFPVNSLSTFRQNKEISESYAIRNFANPEEFLDLVYNPKYYPGRSPGEG